MPLDMQVTHDTFSTNNTVFLKICIPRLRNSIAIVLRTCQCLFVHVATYISTAVDSIAVHAMYGQVRTSACLAETSSLLELGTAAHSGSIGGVICWAGRW